MDFFSITLLFVSLQNYLEPNEKNIITDYISRFILPTPSLQLGIAVFTFYVRLWFSYYINKKIVHGSQYIQNVLREKITKQILFSDTKEGIYDFQDLLFRQTLQLGNVVYQSYFFVLGNVCCLFSVLLFFFIIKPSLTLITFIIFICIILSLKKYSLKLSSKGGGTNKSSGRLVSEIDTILRFQNDIVGYRSIEMFIARLIARSNECAENNIYSFMLSMRVKYFFELIFVIFVTLLVIIFNLITFEKSYFVLILTSSLIVYRVVPTLYTIISSSFKILYNSNSIEKIYNYIGYNEKGDFKFSKYTDFNVVYNKLEVRGLHVNINGSSLSALKDLNFKVNCGESLAIIGESGVGKTKLIETITGLHSQYTGEIFWYSNSKKYLPIDSLGTISIVSQTPFLFSGTITENIVLNKKIDEKLLQNVATKTLKNSNLLFKENSKILEYKIQDGAENLSGGQKYRICIARALYHGLNVIIFDEPTAAVDIKAKKEFLSIIEELSKDIILIIITHDSLVASHCTNIIKLSKKN